jgi:hypothetical protein
MRNRTTISSEDLRVRGYMRGLGIDGRMILNSIIPI